MRTILISVVFSLVSLFTFSQGTIAKIKYEQAEEAYQEGKYQDAINYLNEVETILKGTNTRISYLKILCQNKLVEKSKLSDFTLINSLRKNCDTYLQTVDGIPDLEDKFKEVYFISESLKTYPKTQAEYDAILKKQEDEKIEMERKAAQQRAIEMKNQQELAKFKEEKRLQEKEKELRKIDFIALRGGLAVPTNDDSKDLITFNTWLNSGPYAAPFQKGKFGLNSGFFFGFTGIAGLEGINKNLKGKIGVGLIIDVNQTFLTYDWKDLATESTIYSELFDDASYSMFGITSFGIGPSLTIRPSSKKMYIDLYIRPDFNFIWGGDYIGSVSIDEPSNGGFNSTDYDFITYRTNAPKFKLGSTLGINYRINNLFMGINLRLGLVDDSEFTESYDIFDYQSYSSFSGTTTFSTPGLVFNYAGFSIGAIFNKNESSNLNLLENTSK